MGALFTKQNIMKVTIIGAGNMGGALAVGIAKAGRGHELTVTAAHESTLEKFKPLGIKGTTDNASAVKDADVIFVAVKPWIVPAVLEQIAPHITASQIVASVCPGVDPEDFLSALGQQTKLLYVIPNTAVEVCESMTFVLPVSADAHDVQEVMELLDGTGANMQVPMKQLPAVTALASCGIAYAFRYIRAAAEGGVEMGVYPVDATRIVAQTVKGAASLLEAHGAHPEAEIDKVTTPGGLTIKGLNAMEEAGFTNAVIKGLKAGRK